MPHSPGSLTEAQWAILDSYGPIFPAAILLINLSSTLPAMGSLGVMKGILEALVLALSHRADEILTGVSVNSYRGYRLPEEVISLCLWLYFNFAVSLRDVELMRAYRGIQLSYETIRRWCDTFRACYAAKLKRRRPKLGDKWFLEALQIS